MPTELLQIFSPINIILFIAVFTRISGLLTTAPLFSTFPIPMQVKIWLTATIAFIMFPFVQTGGTFTMPTAVPELFLILLKEFSIGYIIGFCTNLVFIGIEMAANLIAVQMGLAISQALDPVSGVTSPVLTRAYTLLAAMVFLSINAHHWLFSAIYKSFTTVPVGYAYIFSGSLTEQVLFLSSQMFIICLGLALPIFGILLISDVLLGLVSKMMPQMNVFMVAMPLKLYIGILLSMIFLRPISVYIASALENFISAITSAF